MDNSTQSSSESQSYKYWAFISYSHQDNLTTRGDGSDGHIQWANWLHEQLETFRVPDGYRDRPAATGEPMPERFFPTFRDEAELPTSHDLGGQIHDALRRSRFLIVIASPRSAGSHYVNEEVRYFRQLGRGNRILTLIVDGEPNVRLRPKAGWTAAHDCFCPALVHPLRADGRVDEAALLSEEPIAADVRIKEAELPRELRAAERTHPDRQDLLDFMKLKLIAGLMGVGLDELVQRDGRRKEEETRQKAKRLRIIATTVSVLAALAIAMGVVALTQRNHAVRRQMENQHAFSLSHFLRADELITVHQTPKALAYLARSIRINPGNAAAARRILFFLQQERWFVPTDNIASNGVDILDVSYATNGQFLLLVKREAQYGSLRFSVDDVTDLQSFVSRLKTASREVDRYVVSQLSPQTKSGLSNCPDGDGDPTLLLTPLVSDLNRLVLGPLIHELQRFEGIILRSETQQLLLQKPQGKDLLRLNRMLIEDVYQGELMLHNEIAVLDGKTRRKLFDSIPMNGNDARFSDNGRTFFTFLMDDSPPGPLEIDPETLAFYDTHTGRSLDKPIPYPYMSANTNGLHLIPSKEILRAYDTAGTRLAIAYNADGRENCVVLYETQTGNRLKIFSGLADLKCIRFSPDNNILSVCKGTVFDVEECYGKLDLFDVSPASSPEEWRCMGSLQFDNPVYQAAFSADTSFVAISCQDGTVHIIHINKTSNVPADRGGSVALSLSVTYKTVGRGGLALSPSGTELVAGAWRWTRIGHDLPITSNGSLPNTNIYNHDGQNVNFIRDTQTGKRISDITPFAKRIVEKIRATFRGPFVWSNETGNIFVTMADNRLQLWSGRTGMPLTDEILMPQDGGVGVPCFSPDNSLFAVVSGPAELEYSPGRVQFFDTTTGLPLSAIIDVSSLSPTHTIHPQMSANGAQLFIHGEHGIYSIVIPGTNTDSPVWLAALAEAACGFRVSDGSIVEELPPEERLSLLRQVNNKLKAEKNDDAWAKYGKWLLDDGVDRFVSPLSTKKMVEQERQTPKNTE